MNKRKAKGLIEIEGIKGKLNNPELIINNVSYNYVTNKVTVEILFNEEGAIFNHSRTFELDNPKGKDLKKTDILTFVSEHDKLKVFS